jgi:hypothetical protein
MHSNCFGMEYSEHYLTKLGQGVILYMHLVKKEIGLLKILRCPVWPMLGMIGSVVVVAF